MEHGFDSRRRYKNDDGQFPEGRPSGVLERIPDFHKTQTGQKRDSSNMAGSLEQTPKKMRPYAEILPYTYPAFYEGKQCYIGFYAIDPATGQMKRKRYKLSHIKGHKQRRRYAQRMIYEIMDKLDHGWNPWVHEEPQVVPPGFVDTCEKYLEYVDARTKKGTLRPDTARSYHSYLRVFREWCTGRKQPVTKCNQLTKSLCAEFLDYVYMDMGASACTRNCYKVWMSGSFFAWLVERDILKEKPTDGIKSLPKSKEPKSRTIIPEKELVKLKEYLQRENPNFLLAVYLLYYCFIRPKEMSMLRIRDFHLSDGTVTIPGGFSKNGKTENVTLPAKVIHHMLDLGIFNSPASYYLFSRKFKPGNEYKKPKAMSDWWKYHVIKDLGWPRTHLFYSLKDTGITRLLHHTDVLTVRDQARHSDISITNIYAQRDNEADEKLRDWNDVL